MGIEPSIILLQILSASSLSSAALSPRLDPRTRRCRSPTSSAPSSPGSPTTSRRCASKCKQQPLANQLSSFFRMLVSLTNHNVVPKCMHVVCSACTICFQVPTARHLFTRRLSSSPRPERLLSTSSRHSRTSTASSLSGELANLEQRELYLAITRILKDQKG